jgi:hypothetical protein
MLAHVRESQRAHGVSGWCLLAHGWHQRSAARLLYRLGDLSRPEAPARRTETW